MIRLMKLGQRAANCHITYDRPITPVAHVVAFPNIFKWGAYVSETNTLYPEQMAPATRRRHRRAHSAHSARSVCFDSPINHGRIDSRDRVAPVVSF